MVNAGRELAYIVYLLAMTLGCVHFALVLGRFELIPAIGYWALVVIMFLGEALLLTLFLAVWDIIAKQLRNQAADHIVNG